jgi:hypothetical protein
VRRTWRWRGVRPQVNQPAKDRQVELDKTWAALKARADAIVNDDIPALDRKLSEAGIGAVGKTVKVRVVP